MKPVVAQPRPRIPKGDPDFVAPPIAWPTMLLFVIALLLWGGVIALVEQGTVGLWLSMPVQAMAIFMMFTVLHDGVHRSLARGYPRLNDLVANFAGYFLSPIASCASFRVAHFAHHRHTNHATDDPDMWSGVGRRWLMPLHWATADLAYIPPLWRDRDKLSGWEKFQIVGSIVLLVSGLCAAVLLGYGYEALVYWVIPSRLAVLWLAFAFNYLPHHPHDVLQSHNPYAATNVREGGEPLMKWVFLYQNYHLIHHLFPSVPFYRYLRIWQKYGRDFRDRGAPTVPLLALSPTPSVEGGQS